MVKKVVKFFNPRVHTGWHKGQSLEYRRRLVQKAHKNDLLASYHSLDALAKVSKDTQTKSKARSDANYFLRRYKKRNKG